MNPVSSDNNETRRDFLVQAGAVIGAASVAGLSAVAIGDEPAKLSLPIKPVEPPAWVRSVTRMTFLMPSQVAEAAAMGVQVMHTNVVWPYYPLRRDGGGLSKDDDRALKSLVAECRRVGVRLVLGLPPFPSATLVKDHPDWRIHPDDTDAARKIVPDEKNLGTRLGCNLGPWGDYFIELCGELVADYELDGYSFDGNYHPPICYCPACKMAYRREKDRAIPAKTDLDDVAYREYFVWRGQKLTDHYRRLSARIRKAKPDAVLMSWTVNAGRYGHFLHSPRAMPTEINQVFDLPMQEWWLDETNIGASVVPAFGATYLKAVAGDRPAAAEPYLMSRGNPYGTDSFPAHERRTRSLLAITCGNVLAMSMGWAGHDVAGDFREVAKLEKYIVDAKPLQWAGMLVSEQTRQFYAYKDIAERFLPHPLGVFRAMSEEHLPLALLNDWDVTKETLRQYDVVVLPNAAALSDAQCVAIRDYVLDGGALVATGESSLFNELGRQRPNFNLDDVFGVAYRGRPAAPTVRPELDGNFVRTLDENYWKQRVGVATLSWSDHEMFRDERLQQLVPNRSARFRGPLALVSDPPESPSLKVVGRFQLEGEMATHPAIVLRSFGKGHVVYFAAALDAALWSYAYPYQRRLLTNVIQWAARKPAPITVKAPMCVHVTHFMQAIDGRRRLILHFFNGVNTTANHGLPAMDVPLREEIIPIHDIEVTLHGQSPQSVSLQPSGRELSMRRVGADTVVKLPPLEMHAIIVVEP